MSLFGVPSFFLDGRPPDKISLEISSGDFPFLLYFSLIRSSPFLHTVPQKRVLLRSRACRVFEHLLGAPFFFFPPIPLLSFTGVVPPQHLLSSPIWFKTIASIGAHFPCFFFRGLGKISLSDDCRLVSWFFTRCRSFDNRSSPPPLSLFLLMSWSNSPPLTIVEFDDGIPWDCPFWSFFAFFARPLRNTFLFCEAAVKGVKSVIPWNLSLVHLRALLLEVPIFFQFFPFAAGSNSPPRLYDDGTPPPGVAPQLLLP